MVLPRTIHDPSPLDPLILLPLPPKLPSSPQSDLDPLLATLQGHIDASGTGTPITALTAAIKQITRNSQILLNAARAGVAEARDGLDGADGVLRGVEYERERVREEIERCQEYAPAYESLDLPSREDFLVQANEAVRDALPPHDSEDYDQTLMIARLEHELEEITRREAQVAQLTKDRDALIKAKKEIKIKFDAVDVHLAGFARSAHAVSSKLKDVADLAAPVPSTSGGSAVAETAGSPSSATAAL
ncbi:hypothetical protein IAU60_004664 [Kwoniella sp. DSM 27419]